MNSFDKVMEFVDSEYIVAEEGSTKQAIQAVTSEDFNKALSYMREGKKNEDPAPFKKAIPLFKKVRKTIADSRTYPVSAMIGNSVFGALYALATSKKLMFTGLLYKDDEITAKLNTIVDAVSQILGMIVPVANLPAGALHLARFFENKSNENKQAGKYFNIVCARMIQFVDLYVSSCEKYIEDYSK